MLRNKIGSYEKSLRRDIKEKFEAEISQWINDGILIPWKVKGYGESTPPMAVEQANKNKEKPVMDFRELNNFVVCHTGDETAMCYETIRAWRKVEGGKQLN